MIYDRILPAGLLNRHPPELRAQVPRGDRHGLVRLPHQGAAARRLRRRPARRLLHPRLLSRGRRLGRRGVLADRGAAEGVILCVPDDLAQARAKPRRAHGGGLCVPGV